MQKKRYASIILDSNIGKLLDYLIPDALHDKISLGMRVSVPIKGHVRKGYVFALKANSEIEKVLPIADIFVEKALPQDLFDLAKWISKYYCTPISKVIRSMIPSSVRKEIEAKTQVFLSAKTTKKELLKHCLALKEKHPSQAKVIEIILNSKKGIFLTELIKMANISRSPIDTLIKKNILQAKKKIVDEEFLLKNCQYFQTKPKKLSTQQQESLNKISKSLEKNEYATHLIHGVTGSGKTEIYLQAIEKALKQKKGIILLVPEISLTPQTIERFRSRFHEEIAVLHHKKSAGEKFLAWQNIATGKCSIVIGARSAIFSPVKNLGLIIVDEEHDSSYKQSEEAPSYHARNVAIMRAHFVKCPVILGSATPSLESYYNAEKEKYILSSIHTRPNKATLADVQIINMKIEQERSKGFTHFSSPLLDGIKKRYEKGEQTLLFLNRRGYHSFLFCKNCSHIIKCQHCDVSLAFHKKDNILLCHACGYHERPTKTCGLCKSDQYLQYKGFGTEHIERSLHAIFPKIRTLRMDRDTTGQKFAHETLLKQFRSGKADVLIGTQMIVKGLHFPSVTLVGVLQADMSLNIPDFRSSENVFQLLTQVAGRSGRADMKGEVIIQTYLPKHPTIQFAKEQNFIKFYEEEMQSRKMFHYPPFSHLVKLNFSGANEEQTKKASVLFRNQMIQKLSSTTTFYPVVASGRAKIKDKFRFFFLIKDKNIYSITNTISKLIEEKPLSKDIKLFVDVDPISTFF